MPVGLIVFLWNVSRLYAFIINFVAGEDNINIPTTIAVRLAKSRPNYMQPIKRDFV